MRVPKGWDERDYSLWAAINSLPSYGLIAGDASNPLLSRKEVLEAIGHEAEKRLADSHSKSGKGSDR